MYTFFSASAIYAIKNCYPPSLIDQEFHKVLTSSKRKQTVPPKQRNLDFGKLISLPYVPFLSEVLTGILKSYGFPVVHKQYNNVNFLMSKLKSKLKDEQVPGVVYHKCQDCEIEYIGQTKRVLKKRLILIDTIKMKILHYIARGKFKSSF